MKICPTCRVQYDDDTLSFCLEDGTPLSAAQGDQPTVVLAETDTVVRPQWESEVTRVGALPPQARPRGGRTGLAVVITAAVMLVVFGAVAIAAYLIYLNSGKQVTSNTNSNSSTPGGNTPSSTPTVAVPSPAATSPAATPSNSYSPTPKPTQSPADPGNIRSEVTRQVYGWKSMMESHDLSGLMSNYADTLDYYTKRSMSSSSVRADKARAFSLYRSMNVSISNLEVTPGPSGDTATATFDKEWTFTGSGTSQGKVRSQLIFRNSNGRWLITSERDLKVYYTR